ncbi:DUF4232 domain-containing protein [Streptomyces sp. Q6]|uniref:DUF4232 domain-containing protein n=1 Tax=Streptomyces citrinus TaxID=3118173 RepID=A0ACD5ACT4_9ACTN
MAKNRTSRTRFLTAAATVALAALSLTACNDGTGVDDEGASVPSSSTPSAPATTPGGDDAKPTTAPASKPAASTPAGRAPTATKAPAATKPVTCQGTDTKTVAAPLTRPINHMLLTVTNTGRATCYLYGYPAVRFGEAQSVPPADEETHPQAVVTLKPGESGYASVRLSGGDDGSGANGHTEKSLTVHFAGRTEGEQTAPARPALPAEGLFIDDSIKVTYWQQSMDDVMSW